MFKKTALLALAVLGMIATAQTSHAAPSYYDKLPLMRYFSSEYADHWVTTDRVNDWSYRYESTLGYLRINPARGYRPLFECLVGGRDHMISPDQYCEGQEYLGVAGYIRERAASGAQMIRRCITRDGQSHFVSTDVRCEGQRQEGILGYIDLR